MVNYEQAIRKPFTDFNKFIIGIIISFIPIANWIAKGFALESSGLGSARPSDKMPEWKNFWKLLERGFLADVITIIYLFPAFFVLLIVVGLVIGPLISYFAIQIPGNFMQMSSQARYDLMTNLFNQNLPMILPAILTAAPILLLAFVLFIVGSFFVPMAVMNYVKTKQFGKSFDFSIVLRKSLNGTYFVAWIVVLIVVGIINAILGYIPYIGDAIAYFITLVFAYTVFGEIYRKVK